MPHIILSDARIESLGSRQSAYDVRDRKLRGFGVRVLPSGAKRFFIHVQARGERIWRIVGDANAMPVDAARTRAASMRAATKRGADALATADDTRFDAVAEVVFRRYARIWKAGTLRVNRSYLRRQILPWFGGTQIGDITQRDVQRWFASLRATPVAADRSAPVLSTILKEAEIMGYRPEGSNPCRAMRRYRRRGRERFLSDDEIARLGARLAAHESARPLEVAAIRLLLLTGCRKSEVFTLRWSDYREGHIFLRDSKTGPRTVWLSHPACNILERLDRSGTWVFPAARAKQPRCPDWLGRFWKRICEEADLPDFRMHDVRHTYATFALRLGESVLAIGRLLGHANAQTTLKYTHLDDAMVREAVETVGSALEG